MSTENDPVDAVIAAILDGKPVDWNQTNTSLSSDDRALIEPLRVLAAIAAQTADASSDTQARSAADERFVLQELLGRGASGEVHRAWDTRLQREVAVKILHRDRPFASSVIAEAQRLARVSHTSIVTIFDIYEANGSAFICMELLKGRTLDAIVRERGAFTAEGAAQIGIQVCRALTAVHQSGLVHRDIKAHNVMLEDDGRVVLMDFGAGVEVGAGQTTVREGTPLYMAPELLEGSAPAPASDLYSVGILLYHLVTAGYPVTGETLGHIRAGHARGAASREAQLHVTRPLADVVARALQPDPADRFESASAMAEALASIVRSRKTLRVAMAVLSVAVVGSGTWMAWRNGTQPLPGGVRQTELSMPEDMAAFGSLSADGRLMTYLSPDGSLKTMDTGTQVIRLLVSGSDRDKAIDFSLFRPGHDTVLFSAENSDCQCEQLREVSSEGGVVRSLLPQPRFSTVRLLDVTANGNRALVRATRDGKAEELGIVDIGNDTYRALVPPPRNMGRATISPDGLYAAYDGTALDAQSMDLFVLDVESGTTADLLTGAEHDENPVWALDGKSILFASNRAAARSLWRLPVSKGRPAGTPSLLQRDMGLFFPLHLSQNGTLLQWRAPIVNVETASFDPVRGVIVGERQPLIGRFAGSNAAPDWSPDGEALVYVSERKVTGPERSTLVVRSARDGSEREIQLPINGPLDPMWSPDGLTLAVRGPGSRNGVRGVRLIDITTGSVRSVFPFDGLFSLQWHPAGTSVFFVGEKGVKRLDVTNGTSSDVAVEGGWSVIRIAPSPDGSQLAVSATREQIWALLLVPAAGGSPRVLYVAEIPGLGVYDWTPDGNRIVITRTADGANPHQQELVTVAVSDGRVTPAGLKADGLASVRMRPDGRAIAYRTGRNVRSLWILERFLHADARR